MIDAGIRWGLRADPPTSRTQRRPSIVATSGRLAEIGVIAAQRLARELAGSSWRKATDDSGLRARGASQTQTFVADSVQHEPPALTLRLKGKKLEFSCLAPEPQFQRVLEEIRAWS